MGPQSKPWAFIALLAILIAVILFGVDCYRHRFVRSDADMLALLPTQDATIFFVDVDALRCAGVLGLITGSKHTQEPDYQEFVRQTRFDYANSLQRIAGAADGNQVFLVIRGRFDWSKLRQYAIAHGGRCTKSICSALTSKSGDWMSLVLIQGDVIGVALSSNATAAEALRPAGRRLAEPPPLRAAWVKISPNLLKKPLSLPVPLRIFAISLESADAVLVSLGPAGDGSEAAFELRLDARCPSPATAETIRNQLEIQTKMLKLGLAREHQQPNPSDLTGLLTSGTFEAIQREVIGRWPLRKEFLKAMQ